jgi:enoyl-[acyl-carrier protein] reductase II
MIKNHFFNRINEAENRGATVDELQELLGRGRSRKGIFEGDLNEGELEIGQITSIIRKIEPVNIIMQQVVDEYNEALKKISNAMIM